jgi:hypothetical protein
MSGNWSGERVLKKIVERERSEERAVTERELNDERAVKWRSIGLLLNGSCNVLRADYESQLTSDKSNVTANRAVCY